MKRWLAALLLLLVLAVPSWGATQKVTLYLDGAVVEEWVSTHGARAEVKLPAAMEPESLRIRPSAGTVIEAVEVAPVKTGKSHGKELARLTERKERLADRLKGLETREEIFRAAAKSQSGKAPRKTKNNPEPLASIRQGTNLALSQLEEVYRQQRLARREFAEIDSRLAELDQDDAPQGRVVRIAFAGKGKGATLSYVRTDFVWTPRYDFRMDDARIVQVTIRPLLPPFNVKAPVDLRLARLADGVPENPVPAMQVPTEPIRLPVGKATYRGGSWSSLAFSMSNTGTYSLPPGDAACYWQGEYLGTIPFAGCRPGASCEIAVGLPMSPVADASP